MYFFMFMLCLNTITSMINTNLFSIKKRRWVRTFGAMEPETRRADFGGKTHRPNSEDHHHHQHERWDCGTNQRSRQHGVWDGYPRLSTIQPIHRSIDTGSATECQSLQPQRGFVCHGAGFVSRFLCFLCFCVFVLCALCIDLVTDQVQPLSR